MWILSARLSNGRLHGYQFDEAWRCELFISVGKATSSWTFSARRRCLNIIMHMRALKARASSLATRFINNSRFCYVGCNSRDFSVAFTKSKILCMKMAPSHVSGNSPRDCGRALAGLALMLLVPYWCLHGCHLIETQVDLDLL